MQRTVYVETENDNYFENNKPAHNGEVLENGFQQWRNSDGLLHRLDGPAVIRPNGSQEWRQDGRLHRLDGPAVIQADGRQEWWQDGKRHRLDGPAVIGSDGSQAWWTNNQIITQEVMAWIKQNNISPSENWGEEEKKLFAEFASTSSNTNY